MQELFKSLHQMFYTNKQNSCIAHNVHVCVEVFNAQWTVWWNGALTCSDIAGNVYVERISGSCLGLSITNIRCKFMNTRKQKQ